MFRSETVSYYKLTIPRTNSWEVMNKLGNLGCVHIKDLNEDILSHEHPFHKILRRCDVAMESINRVVHYLDINNHRIRKPDNIPIFLSNLSSYIKGNRIEEKHYFDKAEEEIRRLDERLQEQDQILEKLEEQIKHSDDSKTILETIKNNLPQNFSDSSSSTSAIGFTYLAGIVDTNKLIRMNRQAFRITRGNILMETYVVKDKLVEDAEDNTKISRSIFFYTFQKGSKDAMLKQLEGAADSADAMLVEVPQGNVAFTTTIARLTKSIEDGINTKRETERKINEIVSQLLAYTETFGVSYIEHLRLVVLKETIICRNLNKLVEKGELLTGYFWCPDFKRQLLKDSIKRLSESTNNFDGVDIKKIRTNEARPTCFKTTDFTKPFQAIVDTYGIPRYKEVNPGIFTVTSFPFLFGVMFGDIGHGLLLFLLGVYLCYSFASAKRGTILKTLGELRYLFLLMGLFATYCGFIYNDFLAIMTNYNNTCYDSEYKRIEGCATNYGIDRVWGKSKNKIPFLNSFKMKLSIVLGVTHMCLGILMKGINTIYFVEIIDFVFEFVPQIVFMLCTFGYMVACIIMKWAKDWTGKNPPNIINIFINLVTKVDEPLWGTAAEQLTFQRYLGSLVCVPLMLFPKPIIKSLCSSSSHKDDCDKDRDTSMLADDGYSMNLDDSKEWAESQIDKHYHTGTLMDDEDAHLIKKSSGDDDHGHGFGELFIHQMIEVIEFVLGSLSNTASYLRLWALSLAHSQLAEVFYSMMVEPFYKSEGFIGRTLGIFIGFTFLILVSGGVLMCMDLMECFLHALRLHWVEFQNKFYKGDGYAYQPYDFSTDLEEKTEDL